MHCAHTPAKCIATHGSSIAQGGPCGNSQEDHFENFFIAVVLPGLSIHMATGSFASAGFDSKRRTVPLPGY
jgi:hypothetical protein